MNYCKYTFTYFLGVIHIHSHVHKLYIATNTHINNRICSTIIVNRSINQSISQTHSDGLQTWVNSLLYPAPWYEGYPIPPSEAIRPLLGASEVVLAL